MNKFSGYLPPHKWQILSKKQYIADVPKYGGQKALLCHIGMKFENKSRSRIVKYIPQRIYDKLIAGKYKLSTAGCEKGVFVFDEKGKIIEDIPMWYHIPQWLYDKNINEFPVLN